MGTGHPTAHSVPVPEEPQINPLLGVFVNSSQISAQSVTSGSGFLEWCLRSAGSGATDADGAKGPKGPQGTEGAVLQVLWVLRVRVLTVRVLQVRVLQVRVLQVRVLRRARVTSSARRARPPSTADSL